MILTPSPSSSGSTILAERRSGATPKSLLAPSGEETARVWSAPVPLRDVVRAGIAETEDLERVAFTVDERPRVVR